MIQTYSELLLEDLLNKPISAEELMDGFISHFSTAPPFLKKLKTETRFFYNKFKIYIKYKNKKIFFVYVESPQNKLGMDYIAKHGFPNLINDLEKNAIKVGYNESSKAKIYFFQ